MFHLELARAIQADRERSIAERGRRARLLDPSVSGESTAESAPNDRIGPALSTGCTVARPLRAG